MKHRWSKRWRNQEAITARIVRDARVALERKQTEELEALRAEVKAMLKIVNSRKPA